MSGVVTFGTSYVGKVDRVPGRCYVVTRVFQVINVPLVPLGGHLVREGSETETFVAGLWRFEGLPIPISWKSFAWGWARTLLFALGLLAFIGILPYMLFGIENRWLAFLLGPPLGVAMLVTWWRTRRGLRATPERARELEALLATLPEPPLAAELRRLRE